MPAASSRMVSIPLSILAVDDNDSIRASMPFIFPAPHYQVQTASNGDRALKGLEANPTGYDVIIVDQKMPQMTGIELVEQMRSRGLTGKVVVLSAHLSAEIRRAYEEMDVEFILAKPFNIQELRLAVDQMAA